MGYAEYAAIIACGMKSWRDIAKSIFESFFKQTTILGDKLAVNSQHSVSLKLLGLKSVKERKGKGKGKGKKRRGKFMMFEADGHNYNTHYSGCKMRAGVQLWSVPCTSSALLT